MPEPQYTHCLQIPSFRKRCSGNRGVPFFHLESKPTCSVLLVEEAFLAHTLQTSSPTFTSMETLPSSSISSGDPFRETSRESSSLEHPHHSKGLPQYIAVSH